MGKQPQSWKCRDCKSCWVEFNATTCLHCKSKNIFILWNPKTRKYNSGKPKRIQLKTLKRIQLKIK